MDAIRSILHSYGVNPEDDSIDDCIAEIAAAGGIRSTQRPDPIAILDKHIPSITDEMDEDPDLFPKDDIGDYCGDQRVCHCGRHIDGFYDYVEHLKEVLEEPTI